MDKQQKTLSSYKMMVKGKGYLGLEVREEGVAPYDRQRFSATLRLPCHRIYAFLYTSKCDSIFYLICDIRYSTLEFFGPSFHIEIFELFPSSSEA